MEGGGSRIGRDGRVTQASLRILLSPYAINRWGDEIAGALKGVPHQLVSEGDADLAFVSRDITGLSTKHELQPHTAAFYDRLRAASSLRWVHTHAAGADRPIFIELRAQGVVVSTSSGSNADVVALTALAGMLALARHFPLLMQAQRERRWASLMGSGLPRDIEGQVAVLVGWGPVAQALARSLSSLGMKIRVARHADAPAGEHPTATYSRLHTLLPGADWLVIASPLSDATRRLVGERELALLPAHAHLVNVGRGEIVDQQALIEALQSRRLAGAFLDVFEHEPLPAHSPLWGMENVIATPHSAGFSDANERRVAAMFLDNLRRWTRGEALVNQVT